jgi:hypothetical protein
LTLGVWVASLRKRPCGFALGRCGSNDDGEAGLVLKLTTDGVLSFKELEVRLQRVLDVAKLITLVAGVPRPASTMFARDSRIAKKTI